MLLNYFVCNFGLFDCFHPYFGFVSWDNPELNPWFRFSISSSQLFHSHQFLPCQHCQIIFVWPGVVIQDINPLYHLIVWYIW